VIRRDVEDELRCDPRVDDAEIAVSVRDGVVALSGVVPTYDQRSMIVRIAQWVSDAPADAALLLVREPDMVAHCDSDIARQAEDAIRWDVEVPSSRISVHADGGELTLEGRVCWEFERQAADRAVRHIAGVRRLENRIEVIPQPLGAAPGAT
jgi:osmotically-inducible protein OsmY